MKKITALILSVCAIFSLLACATVDNAQENGDSSSLADSSILEDAPIIDGYTPDYPVVEYPDYVIEAEGENKYQSYKMQAPSKNASVTEYQDYALQQIDAYMGAIEQDETVEYDTTYITMQLQKRKYAIYTQESAEKIDLILIDVENIIKKHILDDDVFYELKTVIAKQSGSNFNEMQITHYYGKYGNLYFFVLPIQMEYPTFNVGSCRFISHGEHYLLRAWDRQEERMLGIAEAYNTGLINKEQVVELYEIEACRWGDNKLTTIYGNTENEQITTTNVFNVELENAPFVMNLVVAKNIRRGDNSESTMQIQTTYLYANPFRKLPIGVTKVHFGVVGNNGQVIYEKDFTTEKVEEYGAEFYVPGIINYDRNGKINSISVSTFTFVTVKTVINFFTVISLRISVFILQRNKL